MGLSETDETEVTQKFDDLCLDLNLDTATKTEAWKKFEKISENYTLEGDSLHWLACSLYEACRGSILSTVKGPLRMGNCISLTRLLRSANIGISQFVSKMKKWADMGNLSIDFRDKIEKLERNYDVSRVIFKKYVPTFLDVFTNPNNDLPRMQRSRKQRRTQCTATDIFDFGWTVFVCVKGHFPAINDDLVNSYHLLLCVIDWLFADVLLSGRKNLLNLTFKGLPEEFRSGVVPALTEAPCILENLCKKHNGVLLEAKCIKEHCWRPYIKKQFEKKTLKGRMETLSAVMDLANFDINLKSMSNVYEEYLLNFGDFDERMYLNDEGNTLRAVEFRSPVMSHPQPGLLPENAQCKRNLFSEMCSARSENESNFSPSTPLTGRRYLKEKEEPVTPVSTATQSVSKLHALLMGRKSGPSEKLVEIFKLCNDNPSDKVVERISVLGDQFCAMYSKPSGDSPGAHEDFSRKRLVLAENLYYKVLEGIVCAEMRRFSGRDQQALLTSMLGQDVFHRSLFACCLEIVIFSYNAQRIFPWIVKVLSIEPYYFYRVIEVLIRAEEGLSRDVVKHFNFIEEQILESLAWKCDSPLWDAIHACESKTVFKCEDVSLPSQIERDGDSSAVKCRMKRTVDGEWAPSTMPSREVANSPNAADRYSSPAPGSSFKRQLFPNETTSGHLRSPLASPQSTSVTPQFVYHRAMTTDGKELLIPLQITTTPSKQSLPSQQVSNKPKKTGSLSLFLRKFYYLASVRLRDLCDRLDLSSSTRSQMWTCFEYCITHHSDVMMDRHLDQVLMCSMYIMAKVTDKSLSFHDLMKFYRQQPQAQSHVYRSVLLINRSRPASGGCSKSSSPSNDSADQQSVRSGSILPVSTPTSQLPTPTKLAGTSSSFSSEDRGDLIKFYNMIFVERSKAFALQFSNQDELADPPILSPLPRISLHQTSPRKISTNHSVFVSPHKSQLMDTPQKRKLKYFFSRSPTRNLEAINRLMKRDRLTGKRLLTDNDHVSEDQPKYKNKRVMGLLSDRKGQEVQ